MTKEKIAESILKLFPSGDAWDKSHDKKWSKFSKAISSEVTWLYEKSNRLPDEFDPRKATVLKADWLRLFPMDEYDGDLIRDRLIYRDGATLDYVSAGYNVEILDNQLPAYCGSLRMGEPLRNIEWHSVVIINKVPKSEDGKIDMEIVFKINKRSPSHLKLLFYTDYETRKNEVIL